MTMVKTLRTMRREVLSRLFDHLRENYGLDWVPDTMVEGLPPVHQLDAALAFRSDPVLDGLRSALSRLDNGTYGACINCKSEIGEDTLKVDPTRRVCPSCEKKFSGAFSMRVESHIHAVG
jgi:RNA polymerase-binding transcription factor DksA